MSGAPPAPPAHFAGIDNAARVAFKSPVPKDIDVSQAIEPLPITRIAESPECETENDLVEDAHIAVSNASKNRTLFAAAPMPGKGS